MNYCPKATDLAVGPVILKESFSWYVGNSLPFLSHHKGNWNDLNVDPVK